jgi:hypothetical protein
MLTRCSTQIQWHHDGNVADGVAFYVPVGNMNATFDASGGAVAAAIGMAPVLMLTHFSLDVYTNQAVTVSLELGNKPSLVTNFVTLTCAAVLQHNSVYDLPAPHNKDGYLIISNAWARIRVTNGTGNLATPFVLVARAWH